MASQKKGIVVGGHSPLVGRCGGRDEHGVGRRSVGDLTWTLSNSES